MSEQNETVADLVGELRVLAGIVSNGIIVIQGDELADRIEAAWKREKAAIEADAPSALPHTGKWLNGKDYEYEYAYCSECGRMQWADWNSHREAEEKVGTFAENYRYCPGCGAKMEGGEYVK